MGIKKTFKSLSVLFLSIYILFFNSIHAQNLENITINIADDTAQWPPFTYYKVDKGKRTNKIVGFSVDVISEIFKKNDINFTITLLPWKRALKEVKEGESYQLILNATYTKQRQNNYHITRSYYTLSYLAFYSAKKYPSGLVVKNTQYIKDNYKLCGLLGYNYYVNGFTEKEIDKTSLYNYDKLIKVMHHRTQRCDLFIEGYEVFVGFKTIGKNYLDDEKLKYTRIPNTHPKKFHMLISKNYIYSKQLEQIINEGINLMETTGRLNELKVKYNLLY